MEVAKCSNCNKEVSEVGNTYYELWEKKKGDFGFGRKEKVFCESCWKEQEKNYRNYPCDTEEVKRVITKQEIETAEKTPDGYSFCSHGDHIGYDPTKKEWVKTKELTPTNFENKLAGKENDKWLIWVILVAVLIALILLAGYFYCRKTAKKKKKN